jgi:hypothetical protein
LIENFRLIPGFSLALIVVVRDNHMGLEFETKNQTTVWSQAGGRKSLIL